MALVMTPIYTRVLTDNQIRTVTFNSIPQIYTDLKLVMSARSTNVSTQDYCHIRFNSISSGTLYSDTRLEGSGAAASSTRDTSQNEMYFAWALPGANATANTFGNAEVYIPNYLVANFKSVLMDYVVENNTAGVQYIGLTAGLFRSNNAIESISITSGNANFLTNSSFSLYGIIRSGA